MSSQLAHEYVHTNSIGDAISCRETIRRTKESIKPLYDSHNINGYQIIFIEDEHDTEEKLIERKFEKVTKKRFPFVYALVQPTENSQRDFDRLMEELHYIRVDV